MRNKGIDKFLAILLFLLMVVVLGAAVGCLWGFFTLDSVGAFVSLVQSDKLWQILAGAAALVVLLLPLRVVVAMFSRPKVPASILALRTENGTISITMATVNAMAVRFVQACDGVVDVKNSIRVVENGMIILLRLTLAHDVPVAEMCAALQQNLKQYMQRVSGLQVFEVKIMVDNQGQEQGGPVAMPAPAPVPVRPVVDLPVEEASVPSIILLQPSESED